MSVSHSGEPLAPLPPPVPDPAAPQRELTRELDHHLRTEPPEAPHTRDRFARLTVLLTFGLTVFNTWTLHHHADKEDHRQVQSLLSSAWYDLAGGEGEIAIMSAPALTRADRRTLQSAGEKIDSALAIEPENPKGLLLKGVFWAKMQHADEAKKYFLRAGDYAPAHSALARLLFEEDKTDEALRHYQRAIELDKTLPAPHLGLSLCYRKKKLPEKAREALEQCILQDATFAPCYLELGTLHLTLLQEPDEALVLFKRCREIDPALTGCYFNAVALLLRRGDWDEAARIRDEASAHGINLPNLPPRPGGAPLQSRQPSG